MSDRDRPAPHADDPAPARDRTVTLEHVPYRQTVYGEQVVVLAADGDHYMTASELIDAIADRVVAKLKPLP